MEVLQSPVRPPLCLPFTTINLPFKSLDWTFTTSAVAML